jgi:osmoprotectant transport system substrate-binding protein
MVGLRKVYGIERFKEFIPLDTGGPLTLSALRAGQIDVGALFSTDPALEGGDLVLLTDDRDLQPAENVTPIVRTDLVRRYGPRFVAAVDAVSSRLTTDGLRMLNAQLGRPGARIFAVARRWLQDQGLL